ACRRAGNTAVTSAAAQASHPVAVAIRGRCGSTGSPTACRRDQHDGASRRGGSFGKLSNRRSSRFDQ
ncbi:MAG: hypothetical protein LBS86_05895, partial [Treponema sp.]|nr:hypothetical protein [Treponema sp.]